MAALALLAVLPEVHVILRVAGDAVRAELAEVDVAGAMAAHTVFRQRLVRHGRGVTGMTVDLLMAADQLPFAVARVIEGRWLPLLVAVALAAFLTQAQRVRVLPLM